MTAKKIREELAAYYAASVNNGYTLPELNYYPDSLRVSSFPYCGLKHLYTKLTLTEEKLKEKNSTHAGKVFYTTVGTAAHLCFQRFMGQRGKILGNWKCYKCKTLVNNSFVSTCPKCGSEMEYEEFEVKIFNHVSGHLDGIFRANDGKYYLIDYKTSSVRALSYHKKFGSLPYAKNVSQIKAYCAIFERLYGVKISGWFLIYIASDKPEIFEVVGNTISTREKHCILKRIRRWDKHYSIVWNCKKWEEVETLIEEKPCKTVEFYAAEYRGFQPCPLEGICFSKQLPELIRDTWNSERKEFFKRRKEESVKIEQHRRLPT